MGAIGNRVTGVNLVRGFESLPLRFARSQSQVVARNPRSACAGKRRLLIGRTDGAGSDLVIEQTIDPTTWLIVTGGSPSPREPRLLRS